MARDEEELYPTIVRALSETRRLASFHKGKDTPQLGRVRADFRKARKFKVSDDLCAEATRLSYAPAKLHAKWLSEARIPFPICWFEWHERFRQEQIKALGQEIAGHMGNDGDPADAPIHCGMLAQRATEDGTGIRMEEFAFGEPGLNKVNNWPFSWVYDCEETLPSSFTTMSKGILRNHVKLSALEIAFTTKWANENVGTEGFDYIEGKVGITMARICNELIETRWKSEAAAAEAYRRTMVSCSGTFRWWNALMGLLHTRRTVYMVAPTQAAFVPNAAVKPYFVQTTDFMELPKDAYIAISMGKAPAGGWKNRNHEVIGHWCESRKRGLRHEHVWVKEDDTEHATSKCSLPGCEAKKWWRVESTRGDATIGYVDKNYKLIKRGEKINGT